VFWENWGKDSHGSEVLENLYTCRALCTDLR
jgi:hypothetical protein